MALNIAFLVNAAILVLAASVFHRSGHTEVADIAQAHRLLWPLMGSTVAPLLFGIALIAAGQASTITGTLSGQVVMEGFINLRLTPWVRRLVTRALAVVPAVADPRAVLHPVSMDVPEHSRSAVSPFRAGEAERRDFGEEHGDLALERLKPYARILLAVDFGPEDSAPRRIRSGAGPPPPSSWPAELFHAGPRSAAPPLQTVIIPLLY